MTSVELIGPYHRESYGGHTAAVGWSGLSIGDIKEVTWNKYINY